MRASSSKARTGPARALQTVRNSPSLRRARLRCAGEFLKSPHRPARPSKQSGTPRVCAEPGSVVRASSLEAQRVRRAPPVESGTVSRRTPSCASSSKARTGPARPSKQSGTPRVCAEPGSVVRASSLEARTGPARPSKQSGTPRVCAEPGSVVRASSLEARTGPARPSKQSGTPRVCAEPGSVVRASSLEAQRVRRAPPVESGTVSRRTPSCASSSKARTGPARPSKQSGTPRVCAEPGSVVRASSSEAQRVRRAPPVESGTVSRRTPFCASSSEARTGRGAARQTVGTPEFAPAAPLCGEFLRSAKGAARTTSRVRNCFAPHSVLREFLKSPHRAGAALQTVRNSPSLRRARLRCAGEFLRSAKGAARTTSRVRELFRAALRLARVPQKNRTFWPVWTGTCKPSKVRVRILPGDFSVTIEKA